MEEPTIRRPWYPPTLRDIARVSGASLATVSRALSPTGRVPRASADIARIAREMGYSAYAETAPHLIVFTSDVTRTGYRETLGGIMDVAREYYLNVSMAFIAGTPERRDNAVQTALHGRVDGVVVLEFDTPSTHVIEDLPRSIPFSVAGGYPGQAEEFPRAWIDDYAGAEMAAEHLVALGHRRIGYVGLPQAGHPDPRVRGWHNVLAEHNLTEFYQFGTGWSAETGKRAAEGAIAAGVTAVLCGNDDLAFGVIAGLSRAGVRVPEDISVIGMDDHPLAAATVPALTTVRLDFEGLGATAAQLALGLGPHSAPEAPKNVHIPPELVIRASTSSPKA
ncbi:LacI family DNA-binding transcriptional regulator [Trueperella pecoris]|uniref:LacI family DNA-binding transcriptional regulator n=1 Tax=Trueperella pecoris TaxID=2733571 RepID=A0A7M1QWK0_9ACTO|nr:LacI family DNA-binding transcriptional regulator [Trueperella pecoris]QOQ39648.1 LacI family DNA-binding transcriptional regulator [Trueperella pecoris]QOR45725.1 LacI family DNA-binding transcriptional regulator [Trueperella pecoris]QTG75565.1 LacI family DNA-binding transcriptional regulator [Trueperella pecoris]